jgi:hypothetical protein
MSGIPQLARGGDEHEKAVETNDGAFGGVRQERVNRRIQEVGVVVIVIVKLLDDRS